MIILVPILIGLFWFFFDLFDQWTRVTPKSAATAEPHNPTTPLWMPLPEVPLEAPRGIFFATGEPQTFADFDGQEHIIEKLKMQLDGLAPGVRTIPPQLFRGPAGMGKTLLARIIANEHRLRGLMQGQWIEVFPQSFNDLDDVMRQALQIPESILFFDEVHMLTSEELIKLYEFLANNRYQFKGDLQATAFPPTLVLAATTDAGKLPAAFKRRFAMGTHDLRPMSVGELTEVLIRRTTMQIVRDAIDLLVDRTRHSGAPWEGLSLLELAESSARAQKHPHTMMEDVERVFRIEQIDALGLRWLDREVIKVLFTQPKYKNLPRGGGKEFVCYAASEQNVCTLAQLDPESYRNTVRPRLMSRNIVGLRPYYGQALTDAGAERYKYLRT